MADSDLRSLERAARGGDSSAAKKLYWETLRITPATTILDKLVEATLSRGGASPTIWEKLSWLRGMPIRLSEEQVNRIRARSERVRSARDLERIPEEARSVTYCDESGEVYSWNGRTWEFMARLSQPPPGFPFRVFETIAERDAAGNPALGSSCYVRENGGVYRAKSRTSNYTPPGTNEWGSIRFESTRASSSDCEGGHCGAGLRCDKHGDIP